ncbi:uncharacterized protein TRIVIDRAFT_230744 [Trichoderma virens Gv29-8]|uniref:Uncharacterized protein n=1 Tax=Hypocrea virens (strain Gv29-8 / FGSC 10586) TaxID=413071 RepID=G9MTY2_HYPVG|nr:uncharacterized protein TRIVIDRAFT_230744 [Trichoderma virens Gv29-8]EHK22099.1 hypothetical protein TRIVIDRAFT_230744 [Trichoderma virens Gv29-8]
MEANAPTDLGYDSRQDLRVTVRLQVWHYSERGRCPEFNDGLARLFSPEALGDCNHWIPHPAEVVEPDGISIRDDYVPVEVDFIHVVATYNNPQGNPESGVRDVFKKFAPPIVYDYFVSKIQSPPHAMNIYAVANGEEMTEMHIKMKYAHSFFFIPLELRLERFIKPAVAGVNSLPILGSLIFAYMASQGAKIPEGTDFLATSKETLSQLSSKLPWLNDMLDNVENTDEDGASKNSTSENTPTSSGPLVLLGNASTSFEKLRELAGGLKPRLEKLSSGEGLTNQGIVRTILDLRQATIHLSEYEQAIVSFNDEEIGKWNERASHHEKNFYRAGIATLGFTVIAALAFWNPELADLLTTTLAQNLTPNGIAVSGQIVGVGGTATSGLSTIYQYREKSKALVALGDAKNRASDGRVALEGVLVSLRQTQAILALVYIVQVMRQPITCMGDKELERAVKMLGGDLQYLDNPIYSQTLIQDRLNNLVQASINLDTEYQRTMSIMNVVIDIVGRVVETK